MIKLVLVPTKKIRLMKHVVTLLVFTLGMLMSVSAQDLSKIVNAFGKRDITTIESALNSKVQIIKGVNDKVYSKTQAKMVLSSFFKETSPTGAVIIHKGKKAASCFVIFNLNTQKGKYRIYCLEKEVANRFLIHQIRIDKQ